MLKTIDLGYATPDSPIYKCGPSFFSVRSFKPSTTDGTKPDTETPDESLDSTPPSTSSEKDN